MKTASQVADEARAPWVMPPVPFEQRFHSGRRNIAAEWDGLEGWRKAIDGEPGRRGCTDSIKAAQKYLDKAIHAMTVAVMIYEGRDPDA